MDLLEHVSNPFLVADNIRHSLKKGAFLFVTVPWIWEAHYHPKDYWRFMPQGLEELFKEIKLHTIYPIRDKADDEIVPRHRLIGIFENIKNEKRNKKESHQKRKKSRTH